MIKPSNAFDEALNGNVSHTLTHQAECLVRKHPHFQGSSYPLEFRSFERVLVINGRVPSYYLKQLLQSSLSGINGIDRIINEVIVDYSMLGS